MADGRRGGRSLGRRVLGALLWALAGLAALVLVLALVPSSPGDLAARPDPTATYEDAVARFAAATAGEDAVFEPCRSRLLEHGQRTAVAVVLVHGLTNCPRQFVELGEALYADGANVLILRVPRHGIASADGTEIGHVDNVGGLTPQELRDYADASVDIGAGLGDDVRVLGLSMGGAIAGWIAQNREVERVVTVAPALTLPGFPGFVNPMFRNLFSRVPNISVPGSGALDHAYKGSSSRAAASMYQLAADVVDDADAAPPATSSLVVVINDHDDQVDNDDIHELARAWARQGADVDTVVFPDEQGLRHDVIDIQQPGEQTAFVYPVLLEKLGFPA